MAEPEYEANSEEFEIRPRRVIKDFDPDPYF